MCLIITRQEKVNLKFSKSIQNCTNPDIIQQVFRTAVYKPKKTDFYAIDYKVISN